MELQFLARDPSSQDPPTPPPGIPLLPAESLSPVMQQRRANTDLEDAGLESSRYCSFFLGGDSASSFFGCFNDAVGLSLSLFEDSRGAPPVRDAGRFVCLRILPLLSTTLRTPRLLDLRRVRFPLHNFFFRSWTLFPQPTYSPGANLPAFRLFSPPPSWLAG